MFKWIDIPKTNKTKMTVIKWISKLKQTEARPVIAKVILGMLVRSTRSWLFCRPVLTTEKEEIKNPHIPNPNIRNTGYGSEVSPGLKRPNLFKNINGRIDSSGDRKIQKYPRIFCLYCDSKSRLKRCQKTKRDLFNSKNTLISEVSKLERFRCEVYILIFMSF